MKLTDVTIFRIERLDYRYNCGEINYETYCKVRATIISEN